MSLLLIAVFLFSFLTSCAPAHVDPGASSGNTTDQTASSGTASPSPTDDPAVWQRFEASFVGPFDTVTQLIFCTRDEASFERYRKLAEDELWRYHNLYTIYDDPVSGVNLKTVNDRAGMPVRCPEEILDLVELGIADYARSEGRVNIAMGAVLRLWHDVRTAANDAVTEQDKQAIRLPDDAALLEARAHTSIDDVVVDREEGTVLLRDPAMSLDVGAIAKGYATEQVVRRLKEEGLTSGILNVGGNTRTIGRNAVTGNPWNVGIRDPHDNSGQSIVGVVSSEDLSVVTSGHYERFFIFEGRRYSHIIDPDTLYPANYSEAVSILASDSGTADLLSTALMLLSVDDGRRLLARFPGCEALWINGYEITMTEGFNARYRPRS